MNQVKQQNKKKYFIIITVDGILNLDLSFSWDYSLYDIIVSWMRRENTY